MKPINEQDFTRSMLNTIRENSNEITTDNRSEEEELTSDELSEEQKSFRDTVSPRVEFSSFKIYPKNKNVVFSGKFETLGGLEWQFTLEDTNGLYITATNVPISEETITIIKKLKGYYDNWASDWSEKLSTEYNRNSESDDPNFTNSDKV